MPYCSAIGHFAAPFEDFRDRVRIRFISDLIRKSVPISFVRFFVVGSFWRVYGKMMLLPLIALSMPGSPELIFIFFLCLLLFGAKKLPELARGLGKSIGEFQKAKSEIDREIAKAALPVEIKEQSNKVAFASETNGLKTLMSSDELKSS
jgi:sec-independent protein translocase protein TatA